MTLLIYNASHRCPEWHFDVAVNSAKHYKLNINSDVRMHINQVKQ